MSTDSVAQHAAQPAAIATSTAEPAEDLFTLGRRAAGARDAAFGRRGTFVRTRQLTGNDGAVQWRGPRDAAESFVEEDDLPALGGWAAAAEAGVTLLVGAGEPALRAAREDGARLLVRLPFASGEGDAERVARLRALAAAPANGAAAAPWGVLPAPVGEPYGLDTVRFVALCRLTLPAGWHVVADVTTLGPRLAQMCFGFGADELRAPIVSERALRLGANSNNPTLTRKEAVTLIRGAGLAAAERFADGSVEEVTA